MFFRLQQKNNIVTTDHTGYETKDFDEFTLITYNIPPEDRAKLLEAYKNKSLPETLQTYKRNDFLFTLHDHKKHCLIVANDHFGSNEILFKVTKNATIVTDSLSELKKLYPDISIDLDRVNEYFAFGSIQPPQSIFKEVFAVPSAHLLTIDCKTKKYDLQEYWNPASTLADKYESYDEGLREIRTKIAASAEQEIPFRETYGSSLSGGVDSGGLLSALHDATGVAGTAITIGPYGEDSGDLPSARKTAAHVGADHIELYPTADSLKHLPRYMKHLNQPMDGQAILTNGLTFDAAREKGITRMLFGFGTDNMLGCQKYSRLAVMLQKISWLPMSIQKLGLSVVLKMRGNISKDQKEVILASTNTERFLRIKSIHFWANQPFLKHPSDPYKTIETKKLNEIFSRSDLGPVDKYIFADWSHIHIYNRHGMVSRLARPQGISVYNPAYTPLVSGALLRATDHMRMRNDWDKEIFREAVRPVSPEHLYTNKRKSCILEMKKWFADEKTRFDAKKILEDSEFINEVCDIDEFFAAYDTLPTPEIFILRLLALAHWHKEHFHTKN